MRGDSLRDLYAKTIAVFGLGLLAGAGALVDYWPTGVELPGVRAAFAQPVPTGALEAPEALAFAEPRMPAVRVAPRRHLPAPIPSLAVDPAYPEATFALGYAATIVPPASLPALRKEHVFAGEEIALTMPAERPMTMAMLAAPVSSGSDDDRTGFVAGAIKKTGSSIASAGVKTGASIVDAIRTVSGVLRRANPFN
jgi:hypothetical protein